MTELPEGFDSIFRYIVVVSQRAEQLINGAKARTEVRHIKPTLSARDDVDAGEVAWRVLTQEELDAQRQAIVEQFRAEVSGEGFPPESAQLVPDVLPTGGEAAAMEGDEEEPGSRDDELARLQRLLGMVGEKAEPDSEDIEAAEKEAEDLSLDDEDSLLDIEDGEKENND
jgi:DNA-directed RNA polymerase subunit K/omega